MNQIFLSVIIPVYNTEKYLGECLDSVISQKAENVELICVNDGSVDASEEIIKNYAAIDSRIRLITTENGGPSRARNRGIEAARGEYLCFLDSDDTLREGALEEIGSFAEERRPDIFLYSAKCVYETKEMEQAEGKDEYYRSKQEYGGPHRGRDLFCTLAENRDYCDSACLFCINRAWLSKNRIRFFPGILHEDCLFCFQCLMAAKHVWHLEKEFYRYRVRPNSIMTSGASFASLSGRMTCFYEILRYLLKEELPERLEDAICLYMKEIIYNMKKTDFLLEDKEREKTAGWGPEKRLLADCMGIGGHSRYGINMDLYMLGFRTLLRQHQKIICYGAGEIGKMMWHFMCLEGLEEKVIAYAVSQKPESEQWVGSVPVRGIEELTEETDALVILTARWEFQEEMTERARDLGFNRIEKIDFRLEQMISLRCRRAENTLP